MNIRKNSHGVPGKSRSRKGKAALPALIAAGGGLVVGSAAALELGELQVQSALGQPLRASIPYALSPNEVIQDHCVAIRSGAGDLPGLHNASVNVSNGLISISGKSPVMEPMMSANIVVDCPNSAHFSRSYLLFISPRQQPVTVARASTAAAAVAIPTVRRQTAAPRPSVPITPIAQESRYLVQRGDSLSGIVQRLENRNVTKAVAMAAILDANPNAFMNGDPDQLKAGSRLDIPSFVGGSAAVISAVTTPDAPAAAAETSRDNNAIPQTPGDAGVYQGAESLDADTSKRIPATEFLPEQLSPEAAEPVEALAGASEDLAGEPAGEGDYSAAYADLVAGDVVIAEPVAEEPVPAEPAATPTRVIEPGAGTRIVGAPQPAGSSWNWLILTAVALISAFGSYLMFWPKLRERFASKPVGADERVPSRSENSAPHVAPISAPVSEMTVEEIKPTYDNVDFDLSEDSATEENLALDADLVEGTGFDNSAEVDANRDFGFAATMDLDMELPEPVAAEDASAETDIIPPPARPEEDYVVDNEVLPEDESDEYDISMIVDATKMPDPAEVTERDLKAVPVDETGKTRINDDFTVVDEVAQDILEKDYEDELNATQILNAEIEKATLELAESIGEGDAAEVASLDDDATEVANPGDEDAGQMLVSEEDISSEMQLTNLSELDLTETLEAQNDDDDELDLTANIEVEDKTVEMPRDKDGARAR